MSSPGKRIKVDDCKIQIEGHDINRVESTTFLGVFFFIDDNMFWKLHIDNICNKVSKGIGILLRARQVLHSQTLLTLYNALIKPHFTYCISVWGNTYLKHMNKLHIMQKKVIRIITNSDFLAHTAPLFDKHNIMNVYRLHVYFVGVFVFKAINGDLPKYLCNMFSRNLVSRNSINLRTFYCKKKFSQMSIRYNGPKIWNNFSNNCKCSKSVYIFKKWLKIECTKK